ncbi:hypothetical protein FH972_006721 [Carpinus fangiana]|uniref:Uncharacterized protein n=1 Tax=Carpinus fangiana TaxID=176857 RepID=A0A5N6QT55_9ROSI|nr:hypothetical protein FH972_006721 [Carpinus fangiana]
MSWATSAFRWLDLECVISLGRSSVSRWPSFVSSHLAPRGLLMSFSWIVDDVVWGLISAFESVALVSMLCFFFLFCGCTI